jgi:hypothetical protein
VDLTRHRYQGKLLTQADSIALGKQQRKAYPLKTLAAISQRPTAIDALSLYHWSNQGRLTALLPIRAKRMSVSPFTFFRGMPALMLFDQAWQGQHSGLFQQICGDCHVSNFGGYASPERNLLFGINDFDETIVAPFEWDLQRMVASILIASQSLRSRIVCACLTGYCLGICCLSGCCFSRWVLRLFSARHGVSLKFSIGKYSIAKCSIGHWLNYHHIKVIQACYFSGFGKKLRCLFVPNQRLIIH